MKKVLHLFFSTLNALQAIPAMEIRPIIGNRNWVTGNMFNSKLLNYLQS
jgi:hypothetical protein